MDLKITIDGKNVSQYKKTTSLPKFGSSLITDTKKVLNDDEISDLLDNIRKVVETSNVKEYEKRYQFMFMLYASKMASNLFGECYYPFEQEYVFYNQSRKDKNKEDNGKECRIDCVLFKYNETINKMTDLYLIELKVDDSVVSGNNGVLTHLDDINSLFFEGGNKNDNYEYREKINYEFFNYIRENIEYRMKQLDSNFEYRMNQPDSNFKYDEKNELDFNVHFYTIFGFTNEECKENIKYVLEKLKTIEGVKELSKNTDSKLKLDSYFKDNNKTLQTYINNKNEYNKGKKYTYDIKFFFDKNIFDFESWNKHLYRDNMSFIYCDLNNDIEKIKW